MRTFSVALGARSYPVHVGAGILDQLGTLALEAGLPAIVFALALTFFWFRAWLRNLRGESASRVEVPLILQLVPLSGIVTVLICTAADFPLREPSLAFIFFFLAGALARAPSPSAPPKNLKEFIDQAATKKRAAKKKPPKPPR